MLCCVVLFSLCALRAADPNDLEFLEAFAWGDRAAALKELVPDTEDWFYYHCLHHQLSNDRVAFQRTLDAWQTRNRNNWNERMLEMRRRQRLIEFDAASDASWTHLRDELGLSFNHRARHEQRASRHPSALKPEQYGVDVFMKEAQRRGLLDSLTPRGLELVGNPNQNPDFRRAYLGRLTQPDVVGLVDLILADLDYKDSRGFGHHNIHSQLTRAQLEELAQRRPSLLREEAYVTERLARLPAPDADLSQDHAAAVAHFRDVWAFVSTLEPMHNSLKASVLFRLLDHQRRLGVYDEELFRTYLQLPRQVSYLPRDRRATLQRQATEWVNFQYQPGRDIVLPPIQNEEPLVREFLIELLKGAPDASAYLEFFETRWLEAIFAESKILHGVGRAEDWASRLRPEQYRAILDRIELDFAPQNPSYIKPGQAVDLKVDLKRVDSLLLKIYEIQTFNYYSTHNAPVDQAIDLDGMVATHERTLKTAADPGRRVRHSLALPEITRRGVYVVELIGNGVSSRALLHVGHLESVTLPNTAGQAMFVLNDAGETVKNAAVWMNGREFTANEEGIVLLPFSENPGLRFAILRDGDFCSPEQIQHLGEDYSFSAGIHIDAQNLPRRNTAGLVLRPDFRIHGIPLDPKELGSVKVTLAAIDAKGLRTEREFTADFVRNAEWLRSFYVQESLRRLEVSVEAKIKRKVDLEEITLTDAFAIDVNGARAGDTLKQVFLTPSATGWSLEVRGLTGEPMEAVPMQVTLTHPAFTQNVDLQVSSDEAGRVDLGPLAAIAQIHVSGPDGLQLTRALDGGRVLLPPRLHLLPDEAVSLPYTTDRLRDLKAFSLFQIKGPVMLADRTDKVSIAAGEIRIAGLPAGEYTLHLHETGESVALEVIEANVRTGYLLGKTRRLQGTGNRLPSVADVKTAGEEAVVTLRNVTPSTRLAVRAYRYLDGGSDFPLGEGFPSPAQRRVYPPHVQYISGRNIGDEYRYVLERRFRDIFAGTLLERPGLILNPWELRETSAEREVLKQDQAYRGGRQQLNAPAEMERKRMDASGFTAGMRVMKGGEGGGGGEYLYEGRIMPANLDIGYDFLPQGSRWWLNLAPDANGTVRIPLKDLGEHTALDIVVLDRFGTSRVRHTLADKGYTPQEVRQMIGLNPEGSFSRQKTIRVIGANQPVVYPDLATTRYQTIRTLGQAFDLLQSLGGDATLGEFAFLKEWPKLDDAAKLAKYGEFASHELHLFLHERDRAFFDKVVRPYLVNKKDSTLIDRWLLESLTPEDTRLDRLQDRNALELALLARRGGNTEALRASLREAWELLPPDPEGFARLVRTALQAAELDETIAGAKDKARREAEGASEMMRRVTTTSAVGGVMNMAMADGFATGAPAPAAAPPMSRAEKSMSLAEPVMAMAEMAADAPMDMIVAMDGEALAGVVDRLYRALPKTKEWAEQNYYKLRVSDDVPERISVNGFWIDVANSAAVPERLLEAHRNLTEIIAALAFCGLPFEAEAPVEKPEGAQLTLSVATPALLVSEQILPAEVSKDDRPLLLSQQFFRPDDMYRFEGNEQIEKFVTGEFIRRTVYGARVTLTNPTASRRRLNVLLQLPLGAIPLRNGAVTDDVPVLLEPYTTVKVEYFFTFPFAGEFAQFPAHAAADEAIIGKAAPRVFTVKDAPTEVDKTSWAWISQFASPGDTLAFLRDNNLRRLNLDEMAWRLKDRDFYTQAADLLAGRGLFHQTTLSYSVFHKDVPRVKTWLPKTSLASQVGPVFESALLVVDPVEAKSYEHLEYDPLVNPRAHAVGDKRKILNTALNDQYRGFLRNGLYRAELGANERLGLVYYLLLQDRLSEGIAELAKVRDGDLHEKVQADYLRAWVALRTLDLDRAVALVQPHLAQPVPRWNARFNALAQAVKEARGAEAAEIAEPTRQQDLDRLAAQSPSLEMNVEAGKIFVTAHNLKRVTLNLYPMDIELLFSRKPFLAEGGADFAVIKPALSQEIDLKAGGEPEELKLPRGYEQRNLMVEVVGKGQRASTAWYANQLRVRKMESFGQVEVRSAKDGKPLAKTYVKVFARGSDGRESFWKDGYTDLRGRFDYLSLNDRQPEEAAEFSILVLDSVHGAQILSAEPPTR
jgi:hypothetical protein